MLYTSSALADAAQGLTSAASMDEESIESLNTRISRAQPVRLPEDLEPSTSPVTEPDDNQLAASLNQRLKELSVSSIDDVSEPCTGEVSLCAYWMTFFNVQPLQLLTFWLALAGEVLRALIEEKYGKTYGKGV